MEHLRARFEYLAALKSNPMRALEHTTLARLMYSCRNPHRRTPYFLRLERVRRLLRRIDTHHSWKLIAATASKADIPKSTGKRRKSKRRRDSVPYIDVRKLEALVDATDKLVCEAIPKAAERFTVELIARERFVPLATTVVSLFARIFALERPILAG